MGILLTTHQMEIAQTLADRVSIIQKGKLVVEGRTTDVLESFSGNAYVIEVGKPLHADTRDALVHHGAEFQGDMKFRMVLDQPEEIYEVLRQITPIPVLRVERERADLAQVFRHFTQSQTQTNVRQGVIT